VYLYKSKSGLTMEIVVSTTTANNADTLAQNFVVTLSVTFKGVRLIFQRLYQL